MFFVTLEEQGAVVQFLLNVLLIVVMNSSRSLQNPGFMALALIALEKQSLTEHLAEN